MATQGPRSRDLRWGRHSEPGRIYHVTTTVRHRRPVFDDLWRCRGVINVLRELERRGSCETLCFVVMPDHLHWLFRLREQRRLSAVVGAMKSIIAHRHGAPLWQRGFHDHALRREEDLRRLARYIVANPVRVGLVRRVGDYPHWDAVWL